MENNKINMANEILKQYGLQLNFCKFKLNEPLEPCIYIINNEIFRSYNFNIQHEIQNKTILFYLEKYNWIAKNSTEAMKMAGNLQKIISDIHELNQLALQIE